MKPNFVKTNDLTKFVVDFFYPLRVFFALLPLYAFFFLYVWQGLEKARILRSIHEKTNTAEELKRKNDELKIGIVSYTSAERIETLYRRTYQYLPISLGNRTVTVELPPEPNQKRE
ncbi:hypothetical protein P3G55_09210 [Leptospira sp. 96542]|nr:hypothetical protein [Leptospira sp. 96542]